MLPTQTRQLMQTMAATGLLLGACNSPAGDGKAKAFQNAIDFAYPGTAYLLKAGAGSLESTFEIRCTLKAKLDSAAGRRGRVSATLSNTNVETGRSYSTEISAAFVRDGDSWVCDDTGSGKGTGQTGVRDLWLALSMGEYPGLPCAQLAQFCSGRPVGDEIDDMPSGAAAGAPAPPPVVDAGASDTLVADAADVATTQGTATIVDPAAASMLGVKKVGVKVKRHNFGENKGGTYLTVTATLTLRDVLQSGVMLKVRATCDAGEDRLTDSASYMISFDDMDVDASVREDSAPLFFRNPLAKKPAACELVFILDKVGLRGGFEAGRFCWRAGKVTDGACAP